MNKNKILFILMGILILLTGLTLSFFLSSKPENIPINQSKQSLENQVSGTATVDQQPDLRNPLITKDRETAKVVRVIDGDTIEISATDGPASGGENGQKIRYIGIDTPETVDPRKAVQCFGQEAAAKNRELVEGKTVSLEKDVSETDKYGRLLRYVYFDASTSSGQVIFVNELLVKEGFAHASSYPPDVKYQDQFQKAEQEARVNNLGLWGQCLGKISGRSSEPSSSQSSPTSGCLIKGNISSSGEKIYHMPGQKYYDKTVIDTSRGEKWFCTEQDAQSAGWRKSKI